MRIINVGNIIMNTYVYPAHGRQFAVSDLAKYKKHISKFKVTKKSSTNLNRVQNTRSVAYEKKINIIVNNSCHGY